MCTYLQIRNIQNVIRLTKENLEALNAEFGTHQHPPSIYLQVRTRKHFTFNLCFEIIRVKKPFFLQSLTNKCHVLRTQKEEHLLSAMMISKEQDIFLSFWF